jgi:hypothetical protein
VNFSVVESPLLEAVLGGHLIKIMYWYKSCPFCNQGRLFVFKNLDNNKLYLHCEECERGYEDPAKIESTHSFLTLSENFEAVAATDDDIKNAGWEILELKTLNE